MPSDLTMSTIKSEPGRSAVRGSTPRGVSVSAAFDIGKAEVEGGGDCALAGKGATAAPPAATAPAAVPFRNRRRASDIESLFFMVPLDDLSTLHAAILSHFYVSDHDCFQRFRRKQLLWIQ